MWGLVCAREKQTQPEHRALVSPSTFPQAALCVTTSFTEILQNKKAIECHKVGKA